MTVHGASPGATLREAFGEIDIYLFDQLLKGRFDRRPRILDAGCGDANWQHRIPGIAAVRYHGVPPPAARPRTPARTPAQRQPSNHTTSQTSPHTHERTHIGPL